MIRFAIGAVYALLFVQCSLEFLCNQKPAAADEARPRVDYYDAHGRRTSYSVTDPRTGITDIFDARTSKRLGSYRSPSDAMDVKGNRVGGVIPGLVLPESKGKKK